MQNLTRRRFVGAIGSTGALGGVAHAQVAQAGQATQGVQTAQAAQASQGPDTRAPDAGAAERDVYLWGDGTELQPAEYARLLARLTQGRTIAEDAYMIGGEVEAFEREWAALLGKERAVFMPTGTLANQLAVRALAGTRRRVIVPETSHIYNDTGDACQTLSGLTLMPLAPGRATFTRADVEAVLARTANGRVATEVGALVIESPVRRLRGEMFDWDEAQRITAFARERGIGSHLDGARLFIASAYTGIAPKTYAGAFDTVYVSLWKCFNSGVGAILAGPKSLLDGMFHTRRMFGGNLWNGWPAALVARHYMNGYGERLAAAVRASEEVFAALASHPRVAIERVANGTNVTRLTFKGGADPRVVKTRLAEGGVHLDQASPQGVVAVQVNETWIRRTPQELVRAFEQALA